MAKLSHDASSWRAYGLKKRYETLERDEEVGGKKKAKKDTKKWCRGVEGHPHNIRSVVIGLTPCYRNVGGCIQNPDYNGKLCNHWKSITKCVNCNAKVTGYGWRNKTNPTKTNKKPNGVVTEQQRLAEKWCSEGHLWDWSEFKQDRENQFNRNRWEWSYRWTQGTFVVRDGEVWFETKDRNGQKIWTQPSRAPRVHKICVMCGLERNSQSRAITPDDIPKEFWR